MGHTNLASGRYIFRNPHISNVMYCTTYVMSWIQKLSSLYSRLIYQIWNEDFFKLA